MSPADCALPIPVDRIRGQTVRHGETGHLVAVSQQAAERLQRLRMAHRVDAVLPGPVHIDT